MGLEDWDQELLREPRVQPEKSPLLGLVVFKSKEEGKPSRVPFDLVIRAYSQKDEDGNPDEMAISTEAWTTPSG